MACSSDKICKQWQQLNVPPGNTTATLAPYISLSSESKQPQWEQQGDMSSRRSE